MDDSFPVTLEQWNAELVNIVFFESSHTGSTLSRIDATGRCLSNLQVHVAKRMLSEVFWIRLEKRRLKSRMHSGMSRG